jgi:Dolichyl-phosphate-mannose-protein mannosyltransferase
MKVRLCFLIGFLVILTGIRWWFAASFELSPDESYYYLWAQHPDISYYSKGPGVALAILAGTSLFGPTEFGVRFLSPLLALGTSAFVYLLALRLFRERVAFWSVIVLNLLPVFNLESILITIDSLSIFFWAAALYVFWLSIEHSPRFSIFWLLTGVLVGMGFLCKYENAFQLFSILFFLCVVPKYRSELARPNLYILFLGFVLFLLAPIIWNLRHEWIGLARLFEGGDLSTRIAIRPSHLATSFGGQLAIYSPFLLLAFLVALFGSIRKSFKNSKICYLLTFGWPLLLTYMVLALHQAGEPSWTGPAFVSLGILATHFWLPMVKGNRIVAVLSAAALTLSGLMAALTLNTDLVRMIGIPFPYSLDPSSKLHGWKTIAEAVDRLRANFESQLGTKVFLIGDKYQTSSLLSFYLNDKHLEGPAHPPVYIPESQDIESEFSFWPRYDEFVEADPSAKRDTTFSEESGINPFMDRTALYITDSSEAAPPQNLQSAFTRWELLAVYELDRKHLPLSQIRVFACYQYQTLPL